MNTEVFTRQQVVKAIDELPFDSLPELAGFIEYLRFKARSSHRSITEKVRKKSGSEFLMAIAGIGASDEDDISERDEEVLAKEVDPVYGWNLKKDNSL